MSLFGKIYMARIPDDCGNYIDHDHPVMILNGPDSAGSIYVVAISTKFDPPAGRLMIECPWTADGHDVTGLDQRCVLKCYWVIPWNTCDLKHYMGEMPLEIAQQAVEYAITAVNEKKSATDSPSKSTKPKPS